MFCASEGLFFSNIPSAIPARDESNKEVKKVAKVELKQPIVEEISASIKGAQSVVLVDYRGLTVEEAIEIANASKFGLCGCVFTANMKTAMKVCSALECGGTVINGASFFRSFEMPFGGYKYSGLGTEGVLTTFDEVTRLKTIVLKNIVE